MELLNCSICEKEYKNPITLPCGDTYCEPCIRKTAKKKIIKCESCLKYFSLKYLDFSTNKSLQLVIPKFKELFSTVSDQEARIKAIEKELSAQISSVIHLKQLKEEQDQSHLKIVSELASKLRAFEQSNRDLDQRAETLKDFEKTLKAEQGKLIENEKKIEEKIEETIKICTLKHEELNKRYREVELKELIYNKRHKNLSQIEQKCEDLQKDLNNALKARKVLKTLEIQNKSELRSSSRPNPRGSSRFKTPRSSISSGLYSNLQ